MKNLVYGFAQLAAVIVILITLAVSTAAVAQWADDGQTNDDSAASRQPSVAVASR